MTEEEWHGSESHSQLVGQLHGRPGLARKRRLLLCGCCRVLPGYGQSRVKEFVEAAERFADGSADRDERRRANAAVRDLQVRRVRDPRLLVCYWATLSDASAANLTSGLQAVSLRQRADSILLCQLIRDVFGNPFRPVAFDPDWRTAAAVALARGMYDARDFTHLSVLADALEDAGCDTADVLAHCRDPGGVHVRGCWVVDGVLGLS